MSKTKLRISDKDSLREKVKRRISEMSAWEKIQASQEICEGLRSLSSIQETTNIIVYSALDDEVSLRVFIEWAQSEEKRIFTIDSTGNVPPLPDEGVILVPWRAFTLSGERIGRWGGWYDQFLWEHPPFYKIGACFDCQLFEELPQNIWDISMEEVVYSCPHSGQ